MGRFITVITWQDRGPERFSRQIAHFVRRTSSLWDLHWSLLRAAVSSTTLIQLLSTKLLKEHLPVCEHLGDTIRSYPTQRRFDPEVLGVGCTHMWIPQAFNYLLPPVVLQELLSQETHLCLALSFWLLYLTTRQICQQMFATTYRNTPTSHGTLRKLFFVNILFPKWGAF